MGIYALMLGIGASIGIWRIYQTAPMKQRNEYLNHALLVQFMLLIGARLGYVIQYWHYYQAVPREIFLLAKGGLTLWGAIAGGFLGFILVVLISERRWFQMADALSPMLPPLAICAWLASWRTGVAYGPVAPPDVWWALPAVDEFGVVAERFPLQVLAALAVLLPFLWLETTRPFDGIVGLHAAMSLLLIGSVLSLFTLHRADAEVLIEGYSPALLSSGILLASGVLCMFWIMQRELRRK